MDTSDSEHFESADEDFHSEDENEKQSKTKSVPENKHEIEVQDHLNNLNFNENCDSDIHCEDTNTNPSRTIPKVDSGIVCDSEVNRKCEIQKCVDNNIQDRIEDKEEKRESEILTDTITESDNNTIVTDIPENLPDWKVDRVGEVTFADILVQGINETNIRSESKEVLVDSSDENMWDNDDWEPLMENEEAGNTQLNKSEEPQVDEENMWENDNWENFEEKKEKPQLKPNETSNTEKQSWAAWGNWGVSSILTTATQSVSTLTNQVSQGFSTVLETSMGIPDAEEWARLHLEEESVEEKLEPREQEAAGQNFSGFGFGNLVSGVSNLTKFVEHTGSKVITGGLDTLETIGKKTMEVLQEGDPGLKNKRAFLKLDKEKPILSQVLREAKEKADQENKVLQQKNIAKKLKYESLFDDYHGLVHLEALEMLSKQCDIKLQTLKDNCSSTELTEIEETLDQIKELCELPDEDDEDTPSLVEIEEKITSAVEEINIQISYDKLISTWKETESWLDNLKLTFCDATEIHQQALQSLARLTAMAVEQFHKAGELLLIKEHRSTADEADSLVQLTMASTSLIGLVAGKFTDKLNAKASEHEQLENINEFITNVFFEAANSISYIQDAFQLLVPVLQVGAV